MYFVDRKKIEATLHHMERMLEAYKDVKDDIEQVANQLAVERIAHIVIEAILDVGNAMIDGFIMRDPGSYEDIIDILEDENVVTSEMATPLKSVIGLRTMIVRDFIAIDLSEVIRLLDETYGVLEQFPGKVRYYLENELGPVSAFLPLEGERKQ